MQDPSLLFMKFIRFKWFEEKMIMKHCCFYCNLPLFCLFREDVVDVFEFWPSGSGELKLEDAGKKSVEDPVLLLLFSRTFARGIFTTTRGSTMPMLLFLLQKKIESERQKIWCFGPRSWNMYLVFKYRFKRSQHTVIIYKASHLQLLGSIIKVICFCHINKTQKDLEIWICHSNPHLIHVLSLHF